MKRTVKFSFLFVTLMFTTSNAAYAYIDPGTGSILLQALLGAIAAGLVVTRSYWHKLKDIFTFRSQRKREQQHPSDSSPDE